MSNMVNPVLKDGIVRTVTMEWLQNNATNFVTLTEWPNKEGADLSSYNLTPVQLTNQQLCAIVHCVTKMLMFRNNNN
jgi:hypothetical protein